MSNNFPPGVSALDVDPPESKFDISTAPSACTIAWMEQLRNKIHTEYHWNANQYPKFAPQCAGIGCRELNGQIEEALRLEPA